MLSQIDQRHQFRLKTFSIGNGDLEALDSFAAFARDRLPAILTATRDELGSWPEIAKALATPEVHEARVAHWRRVAQGRFDEEFTPSAIRLADAFLAHDVPAFAVVLCHASVTKAMLRELELDTPCTRLTGFRRSTTKHNRRNALQKAVWFDVEVLLEHYATREHEMRRRIVNRITGTFDEHIARVVGEIDESTRDVDNTMRGIASTAEHSGGHVDAVATAMADANAGVQTVAAAAEELSASVTEITRQVGESTGVAEQAVEDARRTDAVVQALSEGAARIGEVVRLIDAVAGQTNLLALNATIEAARAGEAGKGFAVVANEVKQLAAQTAKATAEIGGQINQMQAATAEAVQAIGSIVQTISRMRDISTGIATSVQEQGAATAEIARSASQAAASNRQVDQLMSGIQSDTRQTTSATGQLGQSVQALSARSGKLSKAVEHFLLEVKSAA
ncbi:methyl-accepting chemotaxis protein [Rhizosaccharibacter radicis]|uniref:Globin-coupled sensor protein n=1 Tax=Rhizosaccharibacter radicis TaxID=2782605 RepID=A0ABT1W1T6_9PROT|nr:globin-coupled sensor protein [Acetobacteraceae bacterium KSS12]